MHTAEALSGADFEYQSGDGDVSRDAVMPSITPEDRVGVAMSAGIDGIGAGNFVLSCVTAFYDHLRATTGDFFEYPDYYTVQTTTEPADYGMLDVYPDHKNVAVEPDAETVLRAINDRAISVLLVPDRPPEQPEVDDIALRSAERRLTHCYLYAPDGQPAESEFAIRLPREPTVEWYESTVQTVESLPDAYALPSFGADDSSITQEFRQVSVTEALSRLPGDR